MSAVTVFDVAAFFLKQAEGRLTTMKLQKLCYYAQAWSLAWDDRELFTEDFAAWANGPVCMDLYVHHRGKYWITLDEVVAAGGNPEKLLGDGLETCTAVMQDYGKFSGTQLSALTHQEAPWLDARKGLEEGAWGQKTITKNAIKTYYQGLAQDSDTQEVGTIEFAPWVV